MLQGTTQRSTAATCWQQPLNCCMPNAPAAAMQLLHAWESSDTFYQVSKR
jgi:hypothetical protein